MVEQRTTYGWISILLHWIGAVGMIVSFITGEGFEDAGSENRQAALKTHVFWALVFALPLLARVIWRVIDKFKTTTRQHRALHLVSRIVMIGLLVSIAGSIISGILLPWSLARPLEIGALIIPSPMPSIPSLHMAMESAHSLFSHLWLPLLLLHILGALKHAIINRDGVFWGILWPRK